MSATPHTAAPRGKKIRVVLKSGEVFVDKFWDRTATWIQFKARGKVRKGDIKAFTILR